MIDESPGGFFLKIISLVFVSTLFSFSLFSQAQAESTFAFAKRVNTYFNVRSYEFPPRSQRHFDFYLMGGVLTTTLRNSATIVVTPGLFGITNIYAANVRSTYNPLGGIGLGYAFHPLTSDGRSRAKIVLGVSGYYLDLGDLKGLEQTPSPTLVNYQFSAHSLAAMFESRFVLTVSPWQPFIVAGIGEAWNTLDDYKEAPTAGPADQQVNFNNGTLSSLAYQLGLGVQYQFAVNNYYNIAYSLALSYNYFSLGSANLGAGSEVRSGATHPIPAGSLATGNLTAQSVLISLTTSFN